MLDTSNYSVGIVKTMGFMKQGARKPNLVGQAEVRIVMPIKDFDTEEISGYRTLVGTELKHAFGEDVKEGDKVVAKIFPLAEYMEEIKGSYKNFMSTNEMRLEETRMNRNVEQVVDNLKGIEARFKERGIHII